MARTLLLLHPVDVPGTGLDGQWYAEITSRYGGTTHVSILPRSSNELPTTATVTSATATSRVVAMSELRAGRPGLLLYSPVFLSVDGSFHYAQIISYHDGVYGVRTKEGLHEVTFDIPVEIAPTLAVLLWGAQLLDHFSTQSDLEEAHTVILDRLLCQNRRRATKVLSRLLTGIVTPQSMPQTSAMVHWRCPWTGAPKLVSVVDVLNFAFYTDGGRTVPANFRIGETFLDGPATRPAEIASATRELRRVGRRSRTANSVAPMSDTQRLERQLRIAQCDEREDSARGPPPSSVEPDDGNTSDSVAARFTDLHDTLGGDQPAPKRRRRFTQCSFYICQNNFDEETKELFAVAKDFGERLKDYSLWSSHEVTILVFWFSNVIGAYRLAVVNDIRSGSNTRHLVRLRFNMQDSELSALFFKASRQRPQRVTGTSPSSSSNSTVVQTIHRPIDDSNCSNGSRRKDRKVPPEVAAQVPKQVGRQL
ncbi:unnamed protein product [Phytophthora fragariaefolia]|uniref:Unnamed protein product n=1 Tax=Phytophthora fragariaefolia TaxID=1490495 RepID=A0A9W6X902_9STRA|nr:unnamed protein product [Phytophthora fragariaefolia]